MIYNLSCEVGFRRKSQTLSGYVVNRAEGLTVTACAGVCKLMSNIINTRDCSKRQPSEEWLLKKKSHSEKSLQANRACIKFGLAFQRLTTKKTLNVSWQVRLEQNFPLQHCHYNTICYLTGLDKDAQTNWEKQCSHIH